MSNIESFKPKKSTFIKKGMSGSEYLEALKAYRSAKRAYFRELNKNRDWEKDISKLRKHKTKKRKKDKVFRERQLNECSAKSILEFIPNNKKGGEKKNE